MANGVLVFAEATEDGKLNPVTAELCGAATKLGGPVTVALLGSAVQGLAEQAGSYGSQRVIVVDDAVLSPYLGDAYLPVAERIAREVDPAIILLGQTMIGRDLAPRLAQRLGTAVAMDCTGLDKNGDKLVAERPCYGGAARARYTINMIPQMATVRVKALEPAAAGASNAEVVAQPAGVDAGSLRTKILDRRKEKSEGVRLEDAKVVVGGGRGLGGPEGFQPLEDMAGLLGGAEIGRASCRERV
jgi:electron transfer flavoprotein alpha subunit